MSQLLTKIEAWCQLADMPTGWTGDGALEVSAGGSSTVVLSYSVDRLWFQQQIGVPPDTTDTAAIAACRLANLARRGVLNARWRVGFVEVTGSLRQEDCTKEAVMWLFDEAATLAAVLAKQLDPA